MFYILIGLSIVAWSFVIFLLLNIDWKDGDWKGKYKGKVLPFNFM